MDEFDWQRIGAAFLVLIAIASAAAIVWIWIYKYEDCRKVGHTSFYCFLDAF